MAEKAAVIDISEALTIEEIARELRRSPRQVRRYIEEGRLPRFVSDADRRRVFVPVADVERFGQQLTPLPERRRIRAAVAA